jgi:peptidyl-prolyl cis-trans isomerase A (cyclophilin A)
MWCKFLMIFGLGAMLSGCGGGADVGPYVTGIQVNTLRYGQTAVLYLAGKYMRGDMTADTGTCTTPTFNPNSTTDIVVLTCKVTQVGPLPLSIKAANGTLLFATTLTVPQPQVTLTTSMGNVVLELNPQVVAATVDNFLQYVHAGYYASALFHRVIAGFVIQGGGYTTGLVQKPGQTAPIALETGKGLSNTRSTVAMARTSDPNSATSEFFVNLVDNPTLDYQSAANPGYAVFGTVVQGMAVVDAIGGVPTGTVGIFANTPTTEVAITSAVQTQ